MSNLNPSSYRLNLPIINSKHHVPAPKPAHLRLTKPGRLKPLGDTGPEATSSLPALPDDHGLTQGPARAIIPKIKYHPRIQACRNDISYQVYMLNRRHRGIQTLMRGYQSELAVLSRRIRHEEVAKQQQQRLRRQMPLSPLPTASLVDRPPLVHAAMPDPPFRMPSFDIDVKVRDHARKRQHTQGIFGAKHSSRDLQE